MKEDYPIDIVITWVDGNDPEWQKERDFYIPFNERKNKSTGGDERYIDDGLLQYIFRGIEEFAPWVNKIHFVTWGHLPKWLDISNPKLHIVKHTDFIPQKYLPTFNANPIVLNLHRIPGLAEHFIFMNDDMYFISPLKRTDFFKKRLPCDMAVQEPIGLYKCNDVFTNILANNVSILNQITNKKKSQREVLNWLNVKYGFKNILKNILLFPFTLFTGIYEPHIPCPYLKSTFFTLWDECYETFDKVCVNKVRSREDCSEYIIKYYRVVKGEFHPINRDKLGTYRNMNSKDLVPIIKNQKKKMICINYYDSNNYEEVKNSFEYILPKKSSFEI